MDNGKLVFAAVCGVVVILISCLIGFCVCDIQKDRLDYQYKLVENEKKRMEEYNKTPEVIARKRIEQKRIELKKIKELEEENQEIVNAMSLEREKKLRFQRIEIKRQNLDNLSNGYSYDDKIKIGMYESEVISWIGEPTNISVSTNASTQRKIYYYSNGVTLHFYNGVLDSWSN